MHELRKKLQDAFCSYNQEKITRYLEQLNPDGSFADVNYTDQSRAEWLTHQHIVRCAELSCAYLQNPALLEKVLNTLFFWYREDYRNPNWWYNDLGVPQQLRLILLNCDQEIPQDIRERMIRRLQTEIDPKWTGMNKLWFLENMIFRAVITKDAALLQTSSEGIAGTIFVSQEGQEGIQVDASFAQHSMQLYNHGYGRDFIIKASLWLELLHDTPYALPVEKVKIITDLYLNGTALMGRFDTMDDSAQSRESVRCYRADNKQAGMHLYIPAAKRLMKCQTDPVIVQKLADTIDFIEGRRTNPYQEGNTAHWVLNFMTHHRDGYYASVRMASKEVKGGDTNGVDIVDGENALGGFGAYGLCVYLRDGKEYEKIFPLFDWGCMPGTTTPDVELPLELGGIHESEFVGSVSDGMYGLSAMDQHKTYTYEGEQVSFGGRFAYFCLDEGILPMGNQLYCNSRKEYHTTIDQCLLNGAVLADGQKMEQDGSYQYLTPVIVSHNRKCYLNLDGHEWKLKAGTVTGDYTRIFVSESTPKHKVTGETFTLVMPHEKEDATYCYAVLPDADPEAAKQFMTAPPFAVLSNGDVQAIKYKDRIFAVFYEAERVIDGLVTISADAPCMLIWYNAECRLWISTPDKEQEQITVKINGQSYVVKMPRDRRYRGSSVEVDLR